MNWYKTAQSEAFDPEALAKRDYQPSIDSWTVVMVSPSRVLDYLHETRSFQDMRDKSNLIDDRLPKAERYISKNINNPQARFEPSKASFQSNGELMFRDGRHRMLAAERLGYTSVALEVPSEQAEEFKNKFSPPMMST